MNEYWKQQAGLTNDEKRVFVERTLADQADFLHSLRTIHSAAENRSYETEFAELGRVPFQTETLQTPGGTQEVSWKA